MVTSGSLRILSRNTFDQTFMTKGVSAAQKVSLSKSQFLWDLEFLNGNGCKSLTTEKKGQQYQEIFCMRLFSRTTFPRGFGSSVDYLGLGAMPVNQNGKTHWSNKNYRFSTFNVFNTSAIMSYFSFGESNHRDLSSNNQPTFLKSLIFQAIFIQLQKVCVKYKFNYPGQFLHTHTIFTWVFIGYQGSCMWPKYGSIIGCCPHE